jgi:formylglycine-generating enzyme required for sulfatase activity
MPNRGDGPGCSRSFAVIAFALLLSAGLAQDRFDRKGPPGGSGANQINLQDSLEYIRIPPGTFQMGCSTGDTECKPHELPQHTVTITQGFWMSKTEVTVSAYKRFVQSSSRSMPAEPLTEDNIALNAGWKQERQPMVQITWDDARAYCEWAGGRLPTEAEWEYAARAGTAGPRYGALEQIAWYGDTSGDSPLDTIRIITGGPAGILRKKFLENRNRLRDVAQMKPNAFGLYDMLGNAWEWVADWYDAEYYSRSPAKDPTGPSSGQARIYRGGSWNNPPYHVRASDRTFHSSSEMNIVSGCRCVLDHP